jgi:hypothetical protein
MSIRIAEFIKNKSHRSAWSCILIVLGLIIISCNKSDDINNSSPTPSDNPPLSYFSIFPDTLVAIVGEVIFLTITTRDTSGNPITNVSPTYTSSENGVIGIQTDGRITAVGIGRTTLTASAGEKTAQVVIYVGSATYDLATLGPPKILNADYIDLSKIGRISRFRSTVGHSFTNGLETCRSMKHYFEPKLSVDWTSVDIYAPASGTILGIRTDGSAGYQIRFRPVDLPAFDISLFHVNIDSGIVKGLWVHAGERIGKHASSFTMSDIAVGQGPKEGGDLISYFEVITDEVFALYQARGVTSREAAIITKEERDSDLVPCVGEEQFTVHGTIPDWLVLN